VCSCGTGIIQEPNRKGMSAVQSHYQRTGEDTADRRLSVGFSMADCVK
jgi:hypothetical protein